MTETARRRADRRRGDRLDALLVLPLLAGGVVAALLLWFPVRLVVGEYRPAWTGQDWNSDVGRPRPETWPFAVLVAAFALWIAYLLATGLRDHVRLRRVAAGLLLVGLAVVGARAVVARPEQRCAQDVYASYPKRVCIGGRRAAGVDLLLLVPTLAPVLALALPNGPRRGRSPSARRRPVPRPVDDVA